MTTLDLEQAQTQLRELLAKLQPGEEILLTDNGEPLAKIIRTERKRWPCKAGSAKDKILWISPNFDAPLDDFQEYME